jgi:diguanylate cyclase
VNNFKAVNDSFGHQAGDAVLRELAQCLISSVRQADIVARYGGDEFVILLPDTEMEKGETLVARILARVREHDFQWRGARIKIEITCGISTTSELEPRESEKELIAKADDRLYDFKRNQKLLCSLAN